MSDCLISGTVYETDGVTPKGRVKLTVRRVLLDGQLISTADKTYSSDAETGVISFILPRGSVAYIRADIEGFDKKSNGTPVTIPDAPAANLEDLIPAVTPPSTAVSQAALQGETAARIAADADLQEQIDNAGGGGAWGSIGGTLPEQTDLQAALDDKADASAVDAIVAAISSDINAEEAARQSADAALQTNITSEASTRAAADTSEASSRASGDASTLSTANAYTDTQVSAEASARATADALLAPKASPALTGTPTAPTAPNATSSTQVATTAFVHALLTELIGTAPANLDTLQEIAAQIASDESAVSALVTTVAGKLAKASNLSDLTDVAQAKLNLSLVKADVGLGSVVNADTTTTANITDSTNKRFVTDAQSTVLGNASGTNTGDETAARLGTLVSGATAKATPVDADSIGLSDSVGSNVLKKFTWANLKTALNAIYQTILTIGNGLSLSSGTVTVDGSKVLMDGSTLAGWTGVGDPPETAITIGRYHKLKFVNAGGLDEGGEFVVNQIKHDGNIEFNQADADSGHWVGTARFSAQDDAGNDNFRVGSKDSAGVFTGLRGGPDAFVFVDSAGVLMSGDNGVLSLPLLPNSSSQDKLLGFNSTSKEIGYLGLGTGLSISASNLSLSSALSAIATLSPSNDDVLQQKAGAWTNRTLAQFKSDLSLSGTNTGDQTSVTGNAGTATALQTARTIDGQSFDGTANITVVAPATHAATGKTTPVDADELPLVDSAASNVLKKLTWANLKATLKTYLDTLYGAVGLMPTFARVTGSNATTTSTTLVDVTGLSVALAANSVYEFTASLTGNGADSNGMKFGVNYSAAGATVEAGIYADVAGTGTRTRRISALNSATAQQFFTSANDVAALITGTITTGANAGNLTIQHLKMTSGTATVYVGSYLKVTKIS